MDNLKKEIESDKKFILIAVSTLFFGTFAVIFVLEKLGIFDPLCYAVCGGIVIFIWGCGLYIRDKKRAKRTGRSEFHSLEIIRAIPKTWKILLLIIFVSAFIFQFLGYSTLSGLSIVLLFFIFFYARTKYAHICIPKENIEKEKELGEWSWSWLSKIMYLILVYLIIKTVISVSNHGFNDFTIQMLWLVVVFIISILLWKKIIVDRYKQK